MPSLLPKYNAVTAWSILVDIPLDTRLGMTKLRRLIDSVGLGVDVFVTHSLALLFSRFADFLMVVIVSINALNLPFNQFDWMLSAAVKS
jgi:anionic cell wall polymer biosynthesis LytR-Cps2A-Psr (LCP) family protein